VVRAAECVVVVPWATIAPTVGSLGGVDAYLDPTPIAAVVGLLRDYE
jgi:hypothetical protein